MEPSASRVPLLEREDLPEEWRSAYDHVAQSRGGVMPNLFKALANSPGAMEQAAALGEYLRFRSSLPDALRELVTLTVAHETRCVYEWTHHGALAERLGIPPAAITRIGDPDAGPEPGVEGLAMRYARCLVRGEDIDDQTVDELRSSLGDAGLVDLAVTVGYYVLLARVLNSLRIGLEPGVRPRPFASRP